MEGGECRKLLSVHKDTSVTDQKEEKGKDGSKREIPAHASLHGLATSRSLTVENLEESLPAAALY